MKRKSFIMNIVMIAGALLIVIVGVLAWFIVQSDAQVEDVVTMSTSCINLQISKDGREYTNDISYVGNVKMDEISGTGCKDPVSGMMQLYMPVKNSFTGEPIKESDGTWKLRKNSLVAGVDYAEMYVYVKSTQPASVYLDKSSLVVPLVTDLEKNPKKRSEFGDFSVDYIAGAARIAIVECKDEVRTNSSGTQEKYVHETLRYLWVPNSTYELSQDPETGYSFTEQGTPETDYTFYDGKKLVSFSETTNCGTGTDYKLTDITQPDENGNYITKLAIRVWVEGTDREAKSVFLGGEFNTKVVLFGVEKSKEGG